MFNQGLVRTRGATDQQKKQKKNALIQFGVEKQKTLKKAGFY
jgi:hypothetical protein|tara:strand:+ start:529 stop:654 length:126 start_codon:yes stop_codon:yes gene_type:complete